MTTTPRSAPPAPPGPPPHGPWPAPFADTWPGPGVPAGPAAVVAILAAGAVAATALPVDRPGLGWLLAGVAAAVAIAVAGRSRAHTGMPPPRVTLPEAPRPAGRYLWAAATLLLLAAGTLRAAEWLFALCGLTALLTAVVATTGGRSIRSLASAAVCLPAAAARALPWLAGGARAIRRGRSRNGPRLALPILLTVLLLGVFGALFASADAAFHELVTAALPAPDESVTVRALIFFPALTLVVGAFAFARAAPPRLPELDTPLRRPARRAEWLLPLAALDLLFAAFVLVQAAMLFGGEEHVRTTTGLTYAEYARSGFWQLLAVTGLTLVVLGAAAVTAPRASRADRTVVRVLLGALAGLTLLIVASALSRMTLYADVYGLTRLRVLVFACEVWLGAVFVMVLVAGVRLRAAWLPRAVLGAAVLGLLTLVAVNPDALIARHNLQHSRLDTAYLRTLSADAAAELARADDDCLLAGVAGDLAGDGDHWRDYNLGRARARALVERADLRRCG